MTCSTTKSGSNGTSLSELSLFRMQYIKKKNLPIRDIFSRSQIIPLIQIKPLKSGNLSIKRTKIAGPKVSTMIIEDLLYIHDCMYVFI